MNRRLAQGFDGAVEPPTIRRCEAVVASARTSAIAPRPWRGDRRTAAAAARRRRARVRADRVGRGEAGRSGCRGPGLPQRRRARHHAPRADRAARLPAGDRGPARPGAHASGGATARSTSTSSRSARSAAPTRSSWSRIRAPRERDFVLAALALARPRRRAARRRPGRRAARATASRVDEAHGRRHPDRLGRCSASRRGSSSTRSSPRPGAPTFTPAVTLPILLVLLGACRGRARHPDPARDARHRTGRRSNPFRAVRIAMLAKASSIVGAVVGGIALGLHPVPGDPARHSVARLVGHDHRDRRMRGAAGHRGTGRGTPLHHPEGR